MAKDLPKRPERDPDAPVKKVSATDRVKAKTDKAEPRFEAARQRLAREEERRARAEAARKAREAETDGGEDGDGTEPAETEAAEGKPAGPKKGFSFNWTARRPNKKDAS